MTDTTATAQAARNELYEVIRKDIPFQEKAREALELGKQYLGADNGHLTQIDQESEHWEIIATTDSIDGQFPPGLELELSTTYCRRVIAANAEIALHDAPNEGWNDDPAFTTHGLHCYHGTPLVLDGEPYGTVCFVSEDPRNEFNDGETMFAELIAQLLERELEQAQHESELTRQRNLALVLNRVLRHNLRNDMSVIRGFTQIMTDKLDDPPYNEIVLRKIDDLIDLADKARQLDRIIGAAHTSEAADITALVEGVVETVTEDYPAASVSVGYDDTVTAAVLPSFEQALTELIENAAKHAGAAPNIALSIEPVENEVIIQIVDNGPGLAEHEAEVLQTGRETPLTHGSGLGLWLTHWIVASHDGSIDASVTDAGTTMTVTIPRTQMSDTHQQQTKLQRARDQYEAAFRESTDAMVIINDEAQIIDANPAASDIYGMDQRALLGQSISRFLSVDVDLENTWSAFLAAEQERDTVTIVGADGVDRQIEYSATTDVVPGQHLVVSRDVTERIKREAELQRKTRAMDEAPVGITLSDPEQKDNPIVYTNEQFSELTGYNEEAVLGQNCRFLQGEETEAATIDKIRQAITDEEAVTETIRNYRKDGTAFWNRLSIAPITDDSGTLENYVGFQEDVTELVEQQRALEKTTNRLRAIIEASPNAIVALDSDGTIQLWNEAAEELFGYEAEMVIGKPIQHLDIHSDDQLPEFEQTFERALAGETLNDHKIQRQTKDGDQIERSLSTAPILDEASNILGVVGVVA